MWQIAFIYFFVVQKCRGAWFLIGRIDAYRPKGREFDSRSSRHVGTLGKSFTYSCL